MSENNQIMEINEAPKNIEEQLIDVRLNHASLIDEVNALKAELAALKARLFHPSEG